MAGNTLVIVTGYGSITPKPWKKAYLNISEENAAMRFQKEHPGVRDSSVKSVQFDDEFCIGSTGEITLY